MIINLVVAASRNNVIGRGGQLPWHLSADLQRFKTITMGKPVVMGRLTHEAIGKPLPGRKNLVVSSQSDYVAAGCERVSSPQAAIAAARSDGEIMVIGGGKIYRQFLPMADRIYLTRVQTEIDGDVFFPALAEHEWRETSREEHGADASNDYEQVFTVVERFGPR